MLLSYAVLVNLQNGDFELGLLGENDRMWYVSRTQRSCMCHLSAIIVILVELLNRQ